MNLNFHTQAGGETGYAYHAREFWSRLQKFHTGEGYPIHIILETVDHPIFYNEYDGIRIAYNVWETTEYPLSFFEHLKRNYDQLWVPSVWQRSSLIKQGFPKHKIFIVPEGVDEKIFFPAEPKNLPEKFRFMIFGKWEARKATEEMVKAFIKAFPAEPGVELFLCAHNPFDPETVPKKLANLGIVDDRIKVIDFLPRSEYIETLRNGHVFVSCSYSEGWNLPLIEAMASGIPSIYSNCSGQIQFANGKGLPIRIRRTIKPFGVYGMDNCPGNWYEPDFDKLVKTLRLAYKDYAFLSEEAIKESEKIRKNYSWDKAVEKAVDILKQIDQPIIKAGKPKALEAKIKPFEVHCNFTNGAVVDLRGGPREKEYDVSFRDKDDTTGRTEFAIRMKRNQNARTFKRYFIDWNVQVREVPSGKTIFTHDFNAKGKNIIVWIASHSMGDHIAWFPYVAKFQKKTQCKMFFASHYNFLFKGVPEYKDINFIRPGSVVPDTYAIYEIGVFFREPHKQPRDWRAIPLQAVASDILGLRYDEIRPIINTTFAYARQVKRPIKYICISEFSTSKCKFWNHEGGWQTLVNHFKEKGYDVVVVSKEETKLKNITNATNNHIDVTMSLLLGCEIFIGLASGLAWLAWALGKKVVMISGFSAPYCEFQSNNSRIAGEGDCTGCVNDPLVEFNRGDWDWCPHKKDFQCTRLITPDIVINRTEEALNELR